MVRKKKLLRILWAVDPFERKTETRSHLLSTLQSFTQGHSVCIEPTYVLSPSEFDISFAFTSPWSKEYMKSAKATLDQCISNLNLPDLLPSKVLLQRQPSLGQSVRALLRYAERSGADLIAVGTHARTGLFRIFLGSFAETLLLHSKLPLLITGPHFKNKKMDQILFATDLGKTADILFERVLELAVRLKSSITLFHVITHPIEPIFQSGVYLLSGGWVEWPEYLSQEEDEKRKVANRYAEIAKKRGVKFNVVIDSSHLSVSALILKKAKNSKASLIALAAESGSVSATFIGSITRQVVREAPCPIWVMRV